MKFEYDKFNAWHKERERNRYIGGSSSGGSAKGSVNNVIKKNGGDRSEEVLNVKDEGVHSYEDQKMQRRQVSQKRARFAFEIPDKHYATEWDEL